MSTCSDPPCHWRGKVCRSPLGRSIGIAAFAPYSVAMCSAVGFSINRLTYPTENLMPGLVFSHRACTPMH
uniref:Uncharacterized protein n=1 Tax=Arundo donax TaxID=35708 RepID=A0A0A9BID8_ARUDO